MRGKKPDMLSPRETFEKYERRSPTHSHHFPDSSFIVETPVQMPNQFVVSEYPNFQEKRKIPYVLIIGLAVGIPVFVMIIMFLAVWMQELGWI